MVAIKLLLPLGRPTCTDDADCLVVFTHGVHDENQPLGDGADGDEPVLLLRVGFVEDLKVVLSTDKQRPRLFER
jgi:hypothetical protein